MPSETLRFGDYCRVHSAPARYLVDGYGVYVSAQTNELMIGPATLTPGTAPDLPLPDDRELAGMLRAYRAGRAAASPGEAR